jgi:hypothetical protein
MGIRSRHPVVAAGVVAVGLLLAACAQPSGERGSASGGAASTSTAAPTSTVGPPSSTAPELPTTSAPSPPTSAPGKGGGAGQVVVRGTLRKGVEPGCVLLDGPNQQAYLLIGDQGGRLRAGTRVEVVGQPVQQIASFCGEDSALALMSIRPLR